MSIMKFKKVFCLILAILVANICGVASSYAADGVDSTGATGATDSTGSPTITKVYGGKISALTGEEVKFPVYISGNPGIASIKLDVGFDTETFSLVDSSQDATEEETKAASEKNPDGTSSDDTESTEAQPVEMGEALTSGNVISKATDDGCQILWWDTKNAKQDGVLFWVKLKVKYVATIGKYTINVSYYPKDTGNENEKTVEVTCEDGSITVDTTDSTIYGGTVRVKAGETFDYPVYIKNNPGISSAMVYINLNSSTSGIEAVTDEDGEIVASLGNFSTKGSVLANTYLSGWRVMWYTTDGDQNNDGVLFTIRLKAGDTIRAQDLGVSVTCMSDNITNADGEKVSIKATSKGTIKLRGRLYGDVDDNLKIDIVDALYLKRYVAGWDGYELVDSIAANVCLEENEDEAGKINSADVIALERYIAGWKGYEKLPKTA